MLSLIDKWRENSNLIKDKDTTAITTLISKDSENGDKLWLFVAFKNFKNVSEYSYSFLLTDINDQPLVSNYLIKRNEVLPYLPVDIKNKKQIFPIIKNMTRELMDKQLPKNIIRSTAEPIEGDSLKRYEEITDIMVNEYGYRLVEKKEDDWGYTTWKLSRDGINENNKDMKEHYEIVHCYSIQEKLKQTNDNLLPLLKNYDFKPIFTCKFRG